MLDDGVRVPAYVQAMRDVIRPGSIVLDLGAGPGFLAVVACQLGAEHVYAVEPNDAIRGGPALARENGCADRITFIQKLSTEVELLQRADLIVSDLRGTLPLFRHHIPTLADARRRLLAPGGVLLPNRDRLWAAPVSFPETYARILGAWGANEVGVAAEGLRRHVVNRLVNVDDKLQPEHVLMDPVCWGTLDYTTREEPNVRAEIEWGVETAGTCHGVGVWFDTVIAEGITYSTGPGNPIATYGRGFFPWLRPVELEAGDRVQVTLGGTLVDADYLWRWATRVTSSSGQTKAEFRQSTLGGSTLSPQALLKTGADFQPQRSEEGDIALFCLSRMDASHTVNEIALALAERFPDRFPSEQAALERASTLSSKYG